MKTRDFWRGTSGIYEIVNTVTGARYYGSAQCLGGRKSQHFKSLRGQCHRNRWLQKAWNKYGEDAFEFRVLVVVEKEELIPTEQRLLRMFAGKVGCYNIAKDAKAPMSGLRHHAASRKQVSEKLAGRCITWGSKISAAKMGKTRTPAEMAAHAAMRGKTRPTTYSRTPEQRKAQSDRAKLWYAMATPEQRAAVSRKGWKHSEETRKEMSVTRTGRPKKAKLKSA